MKPFREVRVFGSRLVLTVFLTLSVSWVSLAEASETNRRHFLWKIGSEHSTVYLLGSIHAAQQDMYPLPEPILQAYRESEILGVEANLEKSDPAEIQKQMLEAAASDRPLEERLSPELYERLSGQFAEAGLSLEMFSNFHPWFAAIQLTMVRIQRLGFDPSLGIDRYFIQKAAQSGREIQELESAFAQMQILSSLTSAEEELFVKYSLEGLSELSASLEKLKEAWMSGDDMRMAEEMIEKPLREDPAVRPIFEKLFFERNQNMTQKILGYLDSGKNYFVIVGAGHLVGKGGILDLLSRQGILAEQL